MGLVIETGDAWIAATAYQLDVPLATHNRKDFERLPGLYLINFQTH